MPARNRRTADNGEPSKRWQDYQRAKNALGLLMAGFHYAEIAARCGYSDATSAYRACQREMKRDIRHDARQARELELARLDAMLTKLWPLAFPELGGAEDGADPEAKRPKQWAVDRVLAIMDRRAKYLGLDASPGEATALSVVRQYVGVNVENL